MSKDCQIEQEITKEIMKKIKADLKAAGFSPKVTVDDEELTYEGNVDENTRNPLTVTFYIEEGYFYCSSSSESAISLADPHSFQKIVSAVIDCCGWGTECPDKCLLGQR